MATVKPWLDHSPAWRSKMYAEGLTPAKWEAWRKLSDESRKKTSPAEYAKGTGVNRQVREKLEKVAIQRLIRRNEFKPKFRKSTVIRGVALMSLDELRAVANLPNTEFNRYLDRKIKRPTMPGKINPFWYQ